MNKSWIVTILILVILLAGIGGGIYMAKQKEEKAQAAEMAEKEFWEKQKPRIELYFRYNFEGIKSFDYTGTDESPMGISINGYVNGIPEHDFSAYVPGYQSEFNYLVTVSPDFAKAYKDSEEQKNVDDILEEQKESQ